MREQGEAETPAVPGKRKETLLGKKDQKERKKTRKGEGAGMQKTVMKRKKQKQKVKITFNRIQTEF